MMVRTKLHNLYKYICMYDKWYIVYIVYTVLLVVSRFYVYVD